MAPCCVLEDVRMGWDGFCIGLLKVNSSTDSEDCRRRCCGDPTCEVWQWGNPRDEPVLPGLGVCYNGKGLACSSDRLDNFLVLAGQRISHDSIISVEDLRPGTWCVGEGMRQANTSFAAPPAIAVSSCRDACHRDASCSVWQQSQSLGCWYGSSVACGVGGDLVAGERLGRSCGQLRQAQTDYVKVFGVICLVAVILTCCAMAVLLVHARLYLGSRSKRESSKELRAASEECREELLADTTPRKAVSPHEYREVKLLGGPLGTPGGNAQAPAAFGGGRSPAGYPAAVAAGGAPVTPGGAPVTPGGAPVTPNGFGPAVLAPSASAGPPGALTPSASSATAASVQSWTPYQGAAPAPGKPSFRSQATASSGGSFSRPAPAGQAYAPVRTVGR
eukprot:TRINITY_DN26585_c0_g1_i1.p1 TRINITY_DN26585_c0_g1~~TRINITY_DN26585_c0_g1_i1.p1  ORF type:complete len:390 (+),score=54.80 TRINITY_DN26585_c0_g1_i1:82-1251(+)